MEGLKDPQMQRFIAAESQRQQFQVRLIGLQWKTCTLLFAGACAMEFFRLGLWLAKKEAKRSIACQMIP